MKKTIIFSILIVIISCSYILIFGLNNDNSTYVTSFKVELANPRLYKFPFKSETLKSGQLKGSKVSYLYTEESTANFQFTLKKLDGKTLIDFKDKSIYTQFGITDKEVIQEIKNFLYSKEDLKEDLKEIKLNKLSKEFKLSQSEQATQPNTFHSLLSLQV